jgi:hypothetical protein
MSVLCVAKNVFFFHFQETDAKDGTLSFVHARGIELHLSTIVLLNFGTVLRECVFLLCFFSFNWTKWLRLRSVKRQETMW